MFHKKGVISIDKDKASEETLMDAVLDAGADDMKDDGAAWEIVSAPDESRRGRRGGEEAGHRARQRGSRHGAEHYIKLEGKQAQQMLKLMEALEDHDDTKNVWSNFDVDEKEIEASLA